MVTESDTLVDWMYWGNNSSNDDYLLRIADTTTVYVNEEKVVFSNYYCILPDSIQYNASTLPLSKSNFYVYAITWQDAIHHSLEDIRRKKLYDRHVVTRKDFENKPYEYKIAEPTGGS